MQLVWLIVLVCFGVPFTALMLFVVYIQYKKQKDPWAKRIREDDVQIYELYQKTALVGVTFNSPWLISLINLVSTIPGRVDPKICTSQEIKGIGMYCVPKPKRNDSTSTQNGTAVLWIHGGGRIMLSHNGANDCLTCSKIIQLLNVPVMSASYRVNTPFPAALDDLVAAYQWLVQELKKKSSDTQPIRILIAGESAGGGLAAELCQRLYDEDSQPQPVGQFLFQPMLDDRTSVKSELNAMPPHPTWNNQSNYYGWSQYMKPHHRPGDQTIPPYMAASRRTNLKQLPPAWILAGTYDLFQAENKAYHEQLQKCGVESVYNEMKGGFHCTEINGLLFASSEGDSVVDCVRKVWSSFQKEAKRHLQI